MTPPSFLFVALAEYDLSRLTAHGLSGPGGEVFILYEDADCARTAAGTGVDGCLLMIQAERMAAEGYRFEITGPGVWQIAGVPPQYLWIGE